MNIDIQPIRMKHYDCMENILISICCYLHKNWQLLFAKSWEFEYDRNCDYSNKIKTIIPLYDTLSQYLGIEICYYKNDSNIMNTAMNEIINGRPFICSIDGLFTFWHKSKTKFPNHYIIITGYEDGNFNFIDPLYLNGTMQISENYLLKHLNEIRTITMDNIINISVDKLYSDQKEYLCTRISDMMQYLQEFKDDVFKGDEFITKIIQNGEKYKLKIVDELVTVGCNRIKYSDFLQYLNDQNLCDSKKQVDDLQMIANKWNGFSCTCLRINEENYTREIHNLRIKLNQICEMEDNVHKSLQKLFV